ncbi:hypothetical protein DH2020_014632 [Rehmannia glutinosa]|uniref:SOUL heme-binding protein n=1 Tax=Rehmannia glutinosa TaxID=99300 RepID=A0ABR0WWZ7_REHGL
MTLMSTKWPGFLPYPLNLKGKGGTGPAICLWEKENVEFSPRKAVYFLFVFLVLSQCMVYGYPPAPTCARYECPSYSVVQSEKEFEIRSYKDALWVSGPKVVAKSYKASGDKGFLILFSYYEGNNQERVKINMTAPVFIEVQNSTYTVYFYVPENYQSTPLPRPISPEIKQVRLPKYKYAAVIRFDGFITDAIIPIKIAALKKSLQGTPYQRATAVDNFFLAGYNSPFEPTNRANELIIPFN